MMAKFIELTNANDTRAAMFEQHKDYQKIIKKNSGRFSVEQRKHQYRKLRVWYRFLRN